MKRSYKVFNKKYKTKKIKKDKRTGLIRKKIKSFFRIINSCKRKEIEKIYIKKIK